LPAIGASSQDLEEEKDNLRLKIWARSVLRNPWSTLDTGDPIAVISETVFFRLVRFASGNILDSLRDDLPNDMQKMSY
jgi:hypothetical protein